MAENQELALLISINQRNPHQTPKGPGTGLLLGTDFRHAVEFSRSGRATTPPFSGFVTGDFPTVRRSRGVHPRGSPRPRGASAAQQERRYTTCATPCTGGSTGRRTGGSEGQATPAG